MKAVRKSEGKSTKWSMSAKWQFDLEVDISMTTKGPKVRPRTTITSTSSALNTL